MTFNSSDSLKADLELLYSDDDTDVIDEVSSVSEYIKIIDGIENGTFYRGQGDARWRIMSSLTRATTPRKDDYLNKKEHNLINFEKLGLQIKIRINDVFNTYVLFKNNLPSYIDEINSKEFLINSNLSTLLLAQHYGLPTRFIDLTINPLTALYFSVSGSTKETQVPAAVFTYDSDVYLTGDEFDHAINKFAESHITAYAIALHSKNDFNKIAKLSSYNYRFMSVEKNLPITDDLCIEHYPFDKRMHSQECLFLFHHDHGKPFLPKNKDSLRKILIKEPYKIKNELMKLGVVESKIYPSLSGYANTLINKKINSDISFFD